MTLVTDALTRVARQCSVSAPSSWLTATADEHAEIRDDFLLETIDDILERVDLPSPIGSQTTITGTGAETYSLPANFKRLYRDNLAVFDKFLDRPVCPVTTDGEWTYIKELGASIDAKYYRVTGYEGNWSISFYGLPSSSVTIEVHYVTKNWLTNGGTAAGDFTDPDDTLLLPRRLVESGIVWRWRERRGLPFQAKYMEYETLLSRLSNDTRGRRAVNFGGNREPIRWQDHIPSIIPGA